MQDAVQRPAGMLDCGVGAAGCDTDPSGYLSLAVLWPLRGCRSGRCADAAVWQGSEEPGQLLLIKSQLWFLSGEPLSKGIRREAPRTCSFPPMTPTHLPGLPCTLPTTLTGRRPELLAAQPLRGGR